MQREHNSRNYCNDSNQILLSDKDQQVHIARAKCAIYEYLVLCLFTVMVFLAFVFLINGQMLSLA